MLESSKNCLELPSESDSRVSRWWSVMHETLKRRKAETVIKLRSRILSKGRVGVGKSGKRGDVGVEVVVSDGCDACALEF